MLFIKADNDPKHTSRRAKKFINDHNWHVMNWPPQSPDLSPIEMLWIDVDRAIKEKNRKTQQN